MYHKSADSWYIGTENGDFEPENESDVPRKREILVHHFFIGKSVENPPGKSGKIICAIVSEHIPGGHMIFPVIIMQKIRPNGGIIRTFSYFWMIFRFKSKFNLLLFFMYFTVG